MICRSEGLYISGINLYIHKVSNVSFRLHNSQILTAVKIMCWKLWIKTERNKVMALLSFCLVFFWCLKVDNSKCLHRPSVSLFDTETELENLWRKTRRIASWFADSDIVRSDSGWAMKLYWGSVCYEQNGMVWKLNEILQGINIQQKSGNDGDDARCSVRLC